MVLTKPWLVLQRRLAGGLELGVLRQQHRQVLLRHRHDAALVAVDHGDGRAPVALAGDEPVAQLVAHGALAPALLLQVLGDGLFCPRTLGGAVEAAGVDHLARLDDRPRSSVLPVPAGRGDDHLDGQVVFLGEGEVALVVGRHAP